LVLFTKVEKFHTEKRYSTAAAFVNNLMTEILWIWNNSSHILYHTEEKIVKI